MYHFAGISLKPNVAPQSATGGPDRFALVAAPSASSSSAEPPRVFVDTDDEKLFDEIGDALSGTNHAIENYGPSKTIPAERRPHGGITCLVFDARRGFSPLDRIVQSTFTPPVIAIIDYGDVRAAVQAMSAGALDCIEIPLNMGLLRAAVERALLRSHYLSAQRTQRKAIAECFASLTQRERQVMDLVLAGHPNKNIAADLGVSQRTVESHRAAIMKKTGARSLPALVRLALTAARGAHNAMASSIVRVHSREERLTATGGSVGALPAPAEPFRTISTYDVDERPSELAASCH